MAVANVNQNPNQIGLDTLERKRRQLLMTPPQTTGPLPEFENARRNIVADTGAQSRAAGMALQRQRAQAGGFGAGSGIKLGQQVEQQLQEQKQRALNDTTAQESAQIRAMQLQREQTQMAGLEAERGREFQQRLFDTEQAFKEKVFKSEEQNKIDLLNLERQKQTFDEQTAGFNKIISALSLESPAEKTRLLASLAEDFKRDKRPEYQKLAEGLDIYRKAYAIELDKINNPPSVPGPRPAPVVGQTRLVGSSNTRGGVRRERWDGYSWVPA